MEEFVASHDGVKAVQKCRRKDLELTVQAPCGGYGQICCSFAPTCPAARPGEAVNKCTAYEPASGNFKCQVDLLPPISQTDYPEGEEFGEEPQGVAHDSSHWYFTARNFVAKVPVSADLGTIGTIQTFVTDPFAGKYNHYGDPGLANGKLYVPLEQGVGGLKNGIGIVDAETLAPITFIDLPELEQAPWCEVFQGVLYTSGDHLGPSQAIVRRYKITNGGIGLEAMPSLVLRNHDYEKAFFLDHVQGGTISAASGTLFISTAASGSEGLSAVWGFDLLTGGFRGVSSIKTSGTYPFIIPEVEGIDYWDNPPSPGIGGQLHVVIAHTQDASPSHQDDYTFAHFSVSNAADFNRF